MIFDNIIMNPPYSRNLHIKILAEAIKHLKDEKSVCVNLSPVRWLQDPLAKYKKSSDIKRFEESVAKHIESLDVIQSDKANDEFKAGIMTDLGIYVCKTSNVGKDFSARNTIVDKVLASKTKMLADVVEHKKRDGIRWQISELQPINAQGGAKGTYGWYRRFCIYNHLRSTIYVDGLKDGKDWTEFTSGISPDKTKTKPFPWSIKFGTIEEATNFENSLKTKFYEYFVLQVKTDQHTPFKFLPFLGDAVNPRTGLLGYKGEWTDADLKAYFQLTDDEWKTVEATMEKYI